MRRPVLALLAAMAASSAHAQRTAVSAGLSPEAAADAFVRTVLDVCVPAIAGNGVSSLAVAREGRVQPTHDAATRRQAGAKPEDTVWDVAAARGVVTVRESDGDCVVAVYGPPVGSTLTSLKGSVSLGGMAARVWMEGDDPVQLEMLGKINGKPVRVTAEGANPGAPGHESRFSVTTATVTAAP
jgi:hypothetical protein